MNLLYGEVIEVFAEADGLTGKIKVRGAIKKIPLGLLTNVAQGDRVLICNGVAISKVATTGKEEENHVSGDSREAH
jgi:hydrogenase maturation factor